MYFVYVNDVKYGVYDDYISAIEIAEQIRDEDDKVEIWDDTKLMSRLAHCYPYSSDCK